MLRRRWSSLWVLAVVSIATVSCVAAPVLMPNDPSLSVEQRAALLRAADEIGRLLDNPLYASQRSLGADGWTHAQFAAYTAGWLSTHGYRVLLAANPSASGTPDTWGLVEIDVGGNAVYIPVNASPAPGQLQMVLGVVPLVSGVFDTAYTTFGQTTPLPGNTPPIAAISAGVQLRALEQTVYVFDGHGSFDPEGSVVLYVWDFGGGETLAMPTPTATHTYRKAGPHTVKLTVLDGLGGMGSTTISINVQVASVVTGELEPPALPPDCGCGH
jgi:hypothetical protein